MTSIIRAARISDAPLLADLHRKCFEEAWDEGSFRSLLERPGAFALLSGEDESQLQAFILIQLAGFESEIQSLGTLPAARRRGLALALVKGAVAEAARRGANDMFLEVAQDNAVAGALYARAGFVRVGHRPAYYVRATGKRADAMILRASLPLRE